MNILDDLFFKYKADKTPRLKHHYSDIYYELFKDRRETVKKVLEIGVAEGASLFAWRDFFPNATIYGAEIDQKRVDLMKGQDRIEVYKFDQSTARDVDTLFRWLEKLEIVIDDGSHNPLEQLFTCVGAMPLLNKDVIYIIEDVDDNLAEEMFKFLNKKYDCDMRHVGSRHDDRLIIVRHKE